MVNLLGSFFLEDPIVQTVWHPDVLPLLPLRLCNEEGHLRSTLLPGRQEAKHMYTVHASCPCVIFTERKCCNDLFANLSVFEKELRCHCTCYASNFEVLGMDIDFRSAGPPSSTFGGLNTEESHECPAWCAHAVSFCLSRQADRLPLFMTVEPSSSRASVARGKSFSKSRVCTAWYLHVCNAGKSTFILPQNWNNMQATVRKPWRSLFSQVHMISGSRRSSNLPGLSTGKDPKHADSVRKPCGWHIQVKIPAHKLSNISKFQMPPFCTKQHHPSVTSQRIFRQNTRHSWIFSIWWRCWRSLEMMQRSVSHLALRTWVRKPWPTECMNTASRENQCTMAQSFKKNYPRLHCIPSQCTVSYREGIAVRGNQNVHVPNTFLKRLYVSSTAWRAPTSREAERCGRGRRKYVV